MNTSFLSLQHFSEVPLRPRNEKHKQDSEQTIKPIWNGFDKNQIDISIDSDTGKRFLHQPDLKSNPSTDNCHGGDGCGGGINDIGKFLPGDPEFVGERSHGITHQQGVGIVVEKDEQPHHHC